LQIINHDIETKIQQGIIANVLQKRYDPAIKHMIDVLDELYDGIPDNKRSSYGVVYTVQVFSRYLFSRLSGKGANVYDIGTTLLNRSKGSRSKGTALGILSYYGIDDYGKVLPYFEASASSSDWNMREYAQMFFRKLIQKWPDEMKEYLLKFTGSKDPNIRRFVSESLRPVKENRWFYERPDYPLSIIRKLFKEGSEYPRTSVGNNLSDMARHLPDLVFELVIELVSSGNRNSYWIAYRACRNLVKEDPRRVMDVLHVNEYRYKKRVYRRSEYPGN